MILDTNINVRINSEVKADFIVNCEGIEKDHTDMLRELISAFNDGRVRIEPTEQQKKQKELYNEH